MLAVKRRIPAAEIPKGAIRPQAGPQENFLATSADIAVYGGAAGGGKTWALLLEPLRHIHNPNFGAVIFRRTSVQIKNEGALWDESMKLYPLARGSPKAHDAFWKFPNISNSSADEGATISMAHLQHPDTVLDWQGSQIPLICFDELTHFTQAQFWYMISRNRSTCGVRPYVRATCNPDVDSWVADLISWWINQDTGYPIPDRAGVVRWFVRVGEKIVWADRPEELSSYTDLEGVPIPPKSLTFIPSKLTDNRVLMNADPGYMANLMALPLVERERLLGGNWKIRWQGRSMFPLASWFVEGAPVPLPTNCDGVFATIDTAVKTGSTNDASATIYWARNMFVGHPLVLLDYDIEQIEGSLLEFHMPNIFENLEMWAKRCGSRGGSRGAWIEDKVTGMVLVQQAKRKLWNGRPWPLFPIDTKLTALGKDERAISVSAYHFNGKCKISQHAYDKVVTYKTSTSNQLITQVTNFSIGDPDAAKRADDLLDCYCYGLSIGLGNIKGY